MCRQSLAVTVSALMALAFDNRTAAEEGVDGISPGLPREVTADDFAALREHSPFLRSVGLSDSLILTGVARIQDEVFATLLDTESRETHLVSRTASPEGWQLVDVQGDESDLESLTAKIQLAGGEMISIRYEQAPEGTGRGATSGGRGGSGQLSDRQMAEAKSAAVNYRKGFSSDGFPDEPPREIVQKLSQMSVGQREAINRRMIELRNRGMGQDERRRIYVDMVNRTSR